MWLYFWNINDEKKNVSPKWPFTNTLPPPPFTPQKKSVPPFCHENYGWEKHVNSIFTGKFVAIFFKAKNFKPKPPFLHQAPPNKCLWTVPKAPGKMSNQNISLTKTTVLWDFQYISLKEDVYLCLPCVFVYILLQSAVSCFTFNFCMLLWNFIRRILSSWRMFLCRIIHCLHFRQPGRHFVHAHSLLSREIIRKSIMSCLHFRINVFQF